MDRSDDVVLGDDLGIASVETRGGAKFSAEAGGKLPIMFGIADDD